MKHLYPLLLITMTVTHTVHAAISQVDARNVILFIADGMGPEQVKAARYFAGTNLVFEHFPVQGAMTHWSANGNTTDSAASATAMATGRKASNGTISVEQPGSGDDLPTVLEYAQSQGRRTGLITTTYITDATPAAFGAHAASRGQRTLIGIQYLTASRPNILLGASLGISTQQAATAGYAVVTNRQALLSIDTQSTSHLSGQFGLHNMPFMADGLGTMPHLTNMLSVALDLLAVNTNGFFLMVENEHTDTLGHGNDLPRLIPEVLALSDAVHAALDWATLHSNTLIIVTSDHETGGLTVTQDNGPGAVPEHRWSTTGHTQTAVPIYAWGHGADAVADVHDNTHISDLFMPPNLQAPSPTTAGLDAQGRMMATWAVSPGDQYRMDWTTDLTADAWMTITTTVPISTTLSLPAMSTNGPIGQRYYRITNLP